MQVLAGKLPLLSLRGIMAAPAFGTLPDCAVTGASEASFQSDAPSRLGSPAAIDVP
ncbi:MAG: hypothetical protein ACYDDO_10510 [Acidiferrobacterales bacterium]